MRFKLIIRFPDNMPYVAEHLSALQVLGELQTLNLTGRTVITIIPMEEL